MAVQRNRVQRSMWLDRGQADWLEVEVARRNAAREEGQPRATKQSLMAEAIQAIGGPAPAGVDDTGQPDARAPRVEGSS